MSATCSASSSTFLAGGCFAPSDFALLLDLCGIKHQNGEVYMHFTQALISSRAISDWLAAEAGSIVSKLNGGLLGIRELGEGGYIKTQEEFGDGWRF